MEGTFFEILSLAALSMREAPAISNFFSGSNHSQQRQHSGNFTAESRAALMSSIGNLVYQCIRDWQVSSQQSSMREEQAAREQKNREVQELKEKFHHEREAAIQLIAQGKKKGEENRILEAIDYFKQAVVSLKDSFATDTKLCKKGEPSIVGRAPVTPIEKQMLDEALGYLGWAQCRAGHIEGAKESLEEALKSNSKNPYTHFYLAKVYKLLDKKEKVREHSKAALTYGYPGRIAKAFYYLNGETERDLKKAEEVLDALLITEQLKDIDLYSLKVEACLKRLEIENNSSQAAASAHQNSSRKSQYHQEIIVCLTGILRMLDPDGASYDYLCEKFILERARHYTFCSKFGEVITEHVFRAGSVRPEQPDNVAGEGSANIAKHFSYSSEDLMKLAFEDLLTILHPYKGINPSCPQARELLQKLNLPLDGLEINLAETFQFFDVAQRIESSESCLGNLFQAGQYYLKAFQNSKTSLAVQGRKAKDEFGGMVYVNPEPTEEEMKGRQAASRILRALQEKEADPIYPYVAHVILDRNLLELVDPKICAGSLVKLIEYFHDLKQLDLALISAQMAAQAGHEEALYWLGEYFYPKKVDVDNTAIVFQEYEKARKLFKKAAYKGHVRAEERYLSMLKGDEHCSRFFNKEPQIVWKVQTRELSQARQNDYGERLKTLKNDPLLAHASVLWKKFKKKYPASTLVSPPPTSPSLPMLRQCEKQAQKCEILAQASKETIELSQLLNRYGFSSDLNRFKCDFEELGEPLIIPGEKALREKLAKEIWEKGYADADNTEAEVFRLAMLIAPDSHYIRQQVDNFYSPSAQFNNENNVDLDV